MKVGLIDIDAKLPNLALMKISSWHKSQGDTTSLAFQLNIGLIVEYTKQSPGGEYKYYGRP
jgi:hypothetical protein